MTKRTVERYIKIAVENLQQAAELEKRNEVLIYCLIESGDLWHFFPYNKVCELKVNHAALIHEGYPANIEDCKARYPELFD